MGVTCCNGSYEPDQIENFSNKQIEPSNHYIIDDIIHIPEEMLITNNISRIDKPPSLYYLNKLEEFKKEFEIPDKAFHLKVYASYDENIFPIWVEKESIINIYVFGYWYLFSGQVKIDSMGDSQNQEIMNFPLGSLLGHVQGGKCFRIVNNISVTSNVSGYLNFLQNNGNFETHPYGFLDVFIVGGKMYKPLELERLSGWNYNLIDTVENASYLQEKEKELIILLNKLRVNPKEFANKYLTHLYDMSEYHRRAFNELTAIGNFINEHGNNENNSVNLNDNDYNNNNNTIKNKSYMNKLDYDRILNPDFQIYKIASKHASDLNKTGSTGHVSIEGHVLEERLKNKNIDTNCFSEVCSFGKSCPIGILLQLLIDDDDVDNSQNRDTLINGNFSHIGISIQKHKAYGSSCVITLVKL